LGVGGKYDTAILALIDDFLSVSYEFEFVFFENLINKTTVKSIFTGSFMDVFLFFIKISQT
jgi:hypothetical protein